MRILFVTSEVYPLVKTGGLADVSYALPSALRQMGVDIRLLIPGYPAVLDSLTLIEVYEDIQLFSHLAPVRILAGLLPDGITPVYVLDSPRLYDRSGGLYVDKHGQEWEDNALRFGALAKAAARFGAQDFWFKPQLVHCNDWQTGLTPAFLAFTSYPKARTLISIHNMAYQGVFAPQVLGLLELPPASFSMYGLEYYGLVSMLKAGLYYADWLSTVSPTYAQEIQTERFGYGLYGLLASRKTELTGILNGIDIKAWNPTTDTYLTNIYSTDDLADKVLNKIALQKRLQLQVDADIPLLGIITRLTDQKGLDLLIPVIPEILALGTQLVILGSGARGLETHLSQLAMQHPQAMQVTIGYDEATAHQIEASADIFLMPSRFEPCGLNQLYSMRYGTVPVVRRTGGLADTVVDATPQAIQARQATGFVFETENAWTLLDCIKRALAAYQDKALWQQLQRTGMTQDFSWQHSAEQYLQLYRRLLD